MPTDPSDHPPASLQDQLDWTLDGETFTLDQPREWAGPVRVLNAVTLDGTGGTIWAQAGPVLHVTTAGVTIRHLRVEYTGEAAGGVALRLDHPDVNFDRVTIRGAVVGLTAEQGDWRYPPQLNLGTIRPGEPHIVRVRVVVPVPCKLTSEVAGVTLQPRTLTPGRHEVRVLIEPMRADTLVCGTLTLETAFLRREVVLNAHALAPATGLEPPAASDRLVWQPDDWDAVATAPPPLPAPPVVVPPRAAAPPVLSPLFTPPTARGSLKSVKGPLLGSLFTSPPATAGTPPDPPPAIEPPVPPTPPAKKPRPPGGLPTWALPPKPPSPPPG